MGGVRDSVSDFRIALVNRETNLSLILQEDC
jgi:hypothetical protein